MLTVSLASDYDAIDVPWPVWEKLASRGSEVHQHPLMTRNVSRQVSRQVLERMNASILELKRGDVSVPRKIEGFEVEPECHHRIKAHEGEARGSLSELSLAGKQLLGLSGAGFEIEAVATLILDIKLVAVMTVTWGTHFEMFGSEDCTARVTKDVAINISYKGQTTRPLKVHFSDPRTQEFAQGTRKTIAFRSHTSLVGTAVSWEIPTDGISVESQGPKSCEVLVLGQRVASVCDAIEYYLRQQIPVLVENVAPVTEPEIIARLEDWLTGVVGKEPAFQVNVVPPPVIYK